MFWKKKEIKSSLISSRKTIEDKFKHRDGICDRKNSENTSLIRG